MPFNFLTEYGLIKQGISGNHSSPSKENVTFKAVPGALNPMKYSVLNFPAILEGMCSEMFCISLAAYNTYVDGSRSAIAVNKLFIIVKL
jgi:hypothetical protein